MAKGLKWYNWLLSLIIATALFNWLTLTWFNFDIVRAITFNIEWLAKTVYTIVGVVGLIGLISIIVNTFK